jgi:hypothetical protein
MVGPFRSEDGSFYSDYLPHPPTHGPGYTNAPDDRTDLGQARNYLTNLVGQTKANLVDWSIQCQLQHCILKDLLYPVAKY